MEVGCKVLKFGVSVDFQDFSVWEKYQFGDLAEDPTIHQQLTTGS